MSERRYLDHTSEGGSLDYNSFPYSRSPKPPGAPSGGNPNISPVGEGNLNGRPAAMDPAPTGGPCMEKGLAFCNPMDADPADYLIQDD